jgi:hypothetical protein
MATPVFLSAPKRKYAGRGNPHAWLKSGAECPTSHGIILGAPRFSPYRKLVPGLPLISWILAPYCLLTHSLLTHSLLLTDYSGPPAPHCMRDQN